MKKLLVFLMFLCASTLYAQDVIVKKDGSTILSKVTKIGTTEVEYKKFSNQEGPTYSILKSDIQAINYENGEKEMFTEQKVSTTIQEKGDASTNSNYNYYSNELIAKSLAQSNQFQKEQLLASAESWHSAGVTLFIVGLVGGIGGGLLLSDGDDTTYWIIAGGGCGAGFISWIICENVSNNKWDAANAITTASILHKDFNLSTNKLSAGINLINDNLRQERTLGLGLSLNF